LKIFPLFADLERVQRWYDNFVEYHKSDWRAKFSTLARPILMLADSDRNSPEAEIAREIVSKTASGLAESIEIAASRLGQQSSTMPLILQGGVCRNSRYYREQIIERSAGLFAKTLIADLGPAAGALMLASDGIVDVLDLQNAIRKHVLEGEGAWNRLIQGR
jgi:N-acetylglucosamine kinase-like BadF-type ATPase